MFFEIYRLFSAGLNNFASRFWYVLPMAVAIIVLTRLRPQVKLLAMAVSMKPTARWTTHSIGCTMPPPRCSVERADRLTLGVAIPVAEARPHVEWNRTKLIGARGARHGR